MPRKHKPSENEDLEIYNKIAQVFRITSQDDRLSIAVRWCQEYDVEDKYLLGRDVAEIYFILAALIDVEHPLIMADRGKMYSFTECILVILRASHNCSVQPIPYRISVHTPPVYSLCTPVVVSSDRPLTC